MTAARIFRTIGIFCVVVLALSAAVVADFYTYQRFTPIKAFAADKGRNGLWLQYTWYMGKHTDADREELIKRLTGNGIEYAYFHVLTVMKDGSLHHHRLDTARNLTAAIHQQAPHVKALAWIYAGSKLTKGPVDLSDAAVRAKMVAEALWLVKACGFDGVQWDYEFCMNGDRGFLRLLDETKAALPKTAIISCATPMWYPAVLWGWGDSYYQEVARRCDQLAVMCYDSYFYEPRAYAWLVAQQAVHVSRDTVVNPNCTVELGLPTYEDKSKAHPRFAENLPNALRGVYDGLADPATVRDKIAGIALFADYTTDDKKWGIYRKWWLRK